MQNQVALKKDIKEKRELINMMMDRFLPRKDDYPKEIHKAMRYTLFAGGKRFRPYLTILCFHLFKKKLNDEVIKAASAIEFLHTYTLIHDDLPEIDNDDYRRGKKTCHVMFGSDIALLAGDALLIEAFNLVNNLETVADLKINMINEMAILCGERGLIAGQMMDIISEGQNVTKKTVEFIHINKTAKLLQLCTKYGAMLGDASEAEVKKMEDFGKKLGLAFQITDDILDIEGSEKSLGKTIGKDIEEKKVTYPSVYGLDKAKQLAEKNVKDALKILNSYGERSILLKELTLYLLSRKS